MNTTQFNVLLWMTQVVANGNVSPRRDLLFQDLAKHDGYKTEKHYVKTRDGYILGVFRIPLRPNCPKSKGTVMFMHGLYLSSDDCLVPGPKKAHCYIYADNCYDVWAPNVRGNLYSRNHTKYDPNADSKFWDFSIDEMAKYDLPAVIDYALKKTGDTQLTYVAHSQGVTILLLLCAKVPKYNQKIKVGIGLSATAWLEHSKFIVVQVQGFLDPLLTLSGGLLDVEVLPRTGLVHNAAKLLCGTTRLAYPVCSELIFTVLGYDQYQITSDVLPVVVGHLPSGTSLKNFNRWGQIRNNGFSEYDYGTAKNLLTYGQRNPPIIHLNKVTMKWVMIASLNDYVADIKDVKKLVANLPNATLCVLSDKTFGHLDFIYGKDIPKYITPIVLSLLKKGSYRCRTET